MANQVLTMYDNDNNVLALVASREIGDACLRLSYSAFVATFCYTEDTTIVWYGGRKDVITYRMMPILQRAEHL